MALGGDQGGSVRIPAAFCGIYGLKPTHGLVPYTGIMPIELTLDHTGPMTATVEDNALLARSLGRAGRARPAAGGGGGRQALSRGIGQGRRRAADRGCRGRVRQSARDASRRRRRARGGRSLQGLGCRGGERVDPDASARASAIWLAMAAEGATMQMMHGNGFRLQLAGALSHVAVGPRTAPGANGPTSCRTV